MTHVELTSRMYYRREKQSGKTLQFIEGHMMFKHTGTKHAEEQRQQSSDGPHTVHHKWQSCIALCLSSLFTILSILLFSLTKNLLLLFAVLVLLLLCYRFLDDLLS